MSETQVTTDSLSAESSLIKLVLQKSGTSLILTWTYPATPTALAGSILLISNKPFNPSNRPTDTALYTASADLSAPADTIGVNAAAQVAAVFYDDLTTVTVTLPNADPAQLYYAELIGVSNVRQYAAQGALSYPLDLHTRSSKRPENQSGDIPESETVPLNPTMGQVYYSLVTNMVSMWNGAIWMPAGTGTVQTGTVFPSNPAPVAGQFFYNTNTGDLDIFNGASWNKANTANEGVPMYVKEGVGTDGTSDERYDLIDTLKSMMGYPTICIELNDTNFNVAIDDALSEFRHRADNAYNKSYILFDLLQGQQEYYLNDPKAGTNRVVDVTKIWRLQALGAYQSNDSGIYNQTFLNMLNVAGTIDLTSIHLMANLSKELEKIFAGNIMFTWHEGSRQMMLARKIFRQEKVILECVMERTEQDLITDRWCKTWIKNWAYARLLEILGNIRSKFGSLPGAGGGITLNGSELVQRADTKYTELKLQIDNYEVGNNSAEWSVGVLVG